MAQEFVIQAVAGSDTELDSDSEVYIVLRIKDEGGNPVTGLGKSNFVVFQMGRVLAPTPILAGSIDLAGLGVLGGTYQFRVTAIGHGQLDFVIVVTSKASTSIKAKPLNVEIKEGSSSAHTSAGHGEKGPSASGTGEALVAVFRSKK